MSGPHSISSRPNTTKTLASQTKLLYLTAFKLGDWLLSPTFGLELKHQLFLGLKSAGLWTVLPSCLLGTEVIRLQLEQHHHLSWVSGSPTLSSEAVSLNMYAYTHPAGSVSLEGTLTNPHGFFIGIVFKFKTTISISPKS